MEKVQRAAKSKEMALTYSATFRCSVRQRGADRLRARGEAGQNQTTNLTANGLLAWNDSQLQNQGRAKSEAKKS
jgi:hypothetical protein